MPKDRHSALFWHLFAGTRGGLNRIRMLQALEKRPYNLNQLAKLLSVDYKTAMHHLEVLVENHLVEMGEKRYGGLYFMSGFARGNIGTLRAIWKDLGKG